LERAGHVIKGRRQLPNFVLDPHASPGLVVAGVNLANRPALTATVTGLTIGTAYAFTVLTTDSAGRQTASAPVTAYTQDLEWHWVASPARFPAAAMPQVGNRRFVARQDNMARRGWNGWNGGNDLRLNHGLRSP
jgi:hypothetical protein